MYQAIFTEYVQQLLCEGQSIEFFIEGTRSRSGKMLQPKRGLLGLVNDGIFSGRVKALHYVPISIDYEKTMEGDLYSNELSGDAKIKESLRGLLSASSVLNVNFGTINVKMGKPISFGDYVEHHTSLVRSGQKRTTFTKYKPTTSNPAPPPANAPVANPSFDPWTNRKDTDEVNKALAYELVHQLAKNTVCMPTHLFATIMLMYR